MDRLGIHQLGLTVHGSPKLLYAFIRQVIVKISEAVDGARWRNLDHAVGNGLQEGMVMRCHEPPHP